MVAATRPLHLAVACCFFVACQAAPPVVQKPTIHQRAKQLEHTRLSSSKMLVASAERDGGGSTIAELVLQIVNNVAGAGILTLSAGMAAGVGWIPASLLCVGLGLLSGLTFYLIGAACEATGETNFKGLWSATLGKRSAWLVDLSIALMCFSAAIIYAGILGDTSTQLLRLARLPESLNLRSTNIALLTLVALTPLSLLEDVSALAFTSALGCVAVLYTGCFIVTRALDGSYLLGGGSDGGGGGGTAGALLASLPAELQPAFTRASRWKLDAKSLILVSNLGLAYIAHYNAPTFYRALDRPSTERFGAVCGLAFSTLSLLYLVIMLMGHRTFGDVTAGNILRNYAERDGLAVLGRVATFASILFGFPLAMLGLKDSMISLLELPRHLIAPLTLSLLSVIALVAILVADIGLVVGISGALLGASLCYVFPALIYGAAQQHKFEARGFEPTRAERLASSLVALLVPFGAFLGILGVAMTVKGA